MGKLKDTPRISCQGLKVLKAFLEVHTDGGVRAQIAGADIMRLAGISSGTMYPLLIRFEETGVLESCWETQKPQDLGRPRRRLYRLTDRGADFAREKLGSLSPGFLTLSPNEA